MTFEDRVFLTKRRQKAKALGLYIYNGDLSVSALNGRERSRESIIEKNLAFTAKMVVMFTMKSGSTTKRGPRVTHGMSYTPEYRAWANIIKRCYDPRNPAFHYYGGRGIKADSWPTFMDFFRDMGRRPSAEHEIDRIDNNGHYSKENCRWATRAVNMANRRNTVMAEKDGQIKPLREWVKILGLSYSRLWARSTDPQDTLGLRMIEPERHKRRRK